MNIEIGGANEELLEKQDIFAKNAQNKHFSLFRKISYFIMNIIQKKEVHLEELINPSLESKIHHEVSINFDLAINHNIILLAAELIGNGYEPSSKQLEQFTTLIDLEIIKDPQFIISLKNAMGHINDSFLAHWFVYHSTQIIQDKQLFPLISDKLVDPVYCHQLVELSMKNLVNETDSFLKNIIVQHPSIGSLSSSDNHYATVEYHSKLTKSYTLIVNLKDSLELDNILSYHKNIVGIQQQFFKKLDSIRNPSYKHYHKCNMDYLKYENFANILNKTDSLIKERLNQHKSTLMTKVISLNKGNYLEAQIKNDINAIPFSIEKQLPKNALLLLEQINNSYQLIHDSRNSINDSDFHRIDNLYENQLKNVLKKYITIDADYRISLLNVEGKNAEELMILSLQNIHSVFEKKLLEINEGRLSDLSVSQRITKDIKNKM